jgi:RNA polymerase sigma-70 factor (ECF subfamily)
MNEQQVQARVRPMDDSELRSQLERHHAASYGWALHCCGRDVTEAEDVLQTAYMKVLDGRARYGGRAAFKTWLLAVIRRTAADARRGRWLVTLGLARYERERPAVTSPDGPADVQHRSELQAAFRAALSKLPRRQQEVLHLVFYQDLSLSEAAGVMGVSVGSARQHYERGKRHLRERLEPWDEFNGL